MFDLDLFDAPVLPGLRAKPDFISEAEGHALIAAIEGQELTPFRFQQWTGKRLTHSFGWKYDFEAERLSRGEPMPDWLVAIRDRVASFAGLVGPDIVQALLIRYDPGAGIGWHRDRPITVRCWAFRSAARRPCASGDRVMAAGNEQSCRLSPGRSTTLLARPDRSGNTASLSWGRALAIR